MPEPTAGRQDQRYLYDAAVSWYAHAAKVSVGVTLSLPAPDPSEPQNILLHKLARALYDILDPMSFTPQSPATDNVYLYSIAQNSFVLYPDLHPTPGRPDQVFLYIITTNLHGYAVGHGINPAMPAPNQGDPINRLYQQLASLSFELGAALP